MRLCLAVVMLTASVPALATTQPGAPVGAPTQTGAWGRSGWQAGATSPTASGSATSEATSAPRPPAVPPEAPYASAAYPSSPVRHRPIEPGRKLPSGYADPIYTVYDWRAYGLEIPYPGTRWIRYFDDAVLADAHGRAIVVRRVAWNAPRRLPVSRRATTPYVPPVASTRTVRTGPDTTVTTQVIPPPTGYYGGGYGPDYGWGPGVTVTPSVVTTTTTTRYEPVTTRRR